MSRYKVLPRRTREGNPEKCPVCRTGWVNLIDINGDGAMLACFACGCVFLSRKVRQEEAAGIKEQIEKQGAEAKKEMTRGNSAAEEQPHKLCVEGSIPSPATIFKCDICGKEVKTALALNGHKRSHPKKAD